MPTSPSKSVALGIAATVGATILYNVLTAYWNLPTRVQRIEDEQTYYHGDKWPPPNAGAYHP